jgi:hypothetical protein
MAEIRIALEELKEEIESGASMSTTPAARKPVNRLRWIMLAASLLALVAALFFVLPRLRETQSPLQKVPLTSYPGYQGEPTLSPDGSQSFFLGFEECMLTCVPVKRRRALVATNPIKE